MSSDLNTKRIANALGRRARDRMSGVKRRTRKGVRLVAENWGYDVVESGPTSLVPRLPPADDPIWTRRSEMPGVDLDLEKQIDFMERELAAYASEFVWNVRGDGYLMWNGLYQAGDAEMLYAMVRHLKPPRFLEIGSGHSTTITAAALRENAREGHSTEFVSVDPEPRIPVDEVAELTAVERVDCRDVPFERFLELRDGDVLFIDTSHVVKLGSEVNWLVLEVLPRLNPGVWVHIHDIHLPYEYPRLTFEYGDLMNEQYLVHALLIGDPRWEIVLALSALAREQNERFFRVVPSIREPIADLPHLPTWLPSAFWMRRKPAAA
jgi:hypothetical protein